MWRETLKNPWSFWRGWSWCVGYLSTKASMMSLLMLLEAVLGPSYLIVLPKHWLLGFRLVGEEFSHPQLSSHICIGQRRFEFTRGSQNGRLHPTDSWIYRWMWLCSVSASYVCITHFHYVWRCDAWTVFPLAFLWCTVKNGHFTLTCCTLF